MTSAAGSVVVCSLFIVAPVFVGALCLVPILLSTALCLFKFCNYLDEEKSDGCFFLICICDIL